MKKTVIFIFFLLSTVSYSQIENQSRKIDIAPPKTKTVLPNVTLLNPNAFTIKKEEKKDPTTEEKKLRENNFLSLLKDIISSPYVNVCYCLVLRM